MPADAGRVERVIGLLLRNRGNPTQPREYWQLADYPATGTNLLLVDGWLSVSGDKHLAPAYLAHVATLDPSHVEPFWRPRVFGFSFDGPANAYIGDDTCDPVQALVPKVAAALATGAPDTKWIIASYSIGAAITVLALRECLEQESSLRSRVPLVILIEPAMHGSRPVMDYFNDKSRKPRQYDFDEVPRVMLDLGADEAGGYPQQAREAVRHLLDSGIALAVIYCPLDNFAPYRPIADTRIHHQKLSAKQIEGSANPPARTYVHFHIARHPDTLSLIYHLTKPLLNLDS